MKAIQSIFRDKITFFYILFKFALSLKHMIEFFFLAYSSILRILEQLFVPYTFF